MTDLKAASICEIIRELINRDEILKLKLDCNEMVEGRGSIRHEVRCKR